MTPENTVSEFLVHENAPDGVYEIPITDSDVADIRNDIKKVYDFAEKLNTIFYDDKRTFTNEQYLSLGYYLSIGNWNYARNLSDLEARIAAATRR